MRLALAGYAVGCDARTIRTDHDEWVGEDRFYVVLRHRTHQDAGGAAIGDDHVTGHIKRVLPALAGEFIDCPARFRGRRIGDADVRPGLQPAEIRKAAFDKLLADAGARVGFGEARQHRIHSALVDPRRQ